MNHMRFNETKWKILYVGWENTYYKYKLEDDVIESSPVKKDLEVLVDKKPDVNQQHALAQKANCILGYIKRNVASRLRGDFAILLW